MIRRFIFIVCAMLCCQFAFAEMCPSVQSIQHHALQGWKVYDSEDGTLLPPVRLSHFQQQAKLFALAEWKQSGRAMHCYYKDQTGSDLEAYLAKENFVPINPNHYWYAVSGALQCAAGMDKCEFKNLPAPQRLAKN